MTHVSRSFDYPKCVSSLLASRLTQLIGLQDEKEEAKGKNSSDVTCVLDCVSKFVVIPIKRYGLSLDTPEISLKKKGLTATAYGCNLILSLVM